MNKLLRTFSLVCWCRMQRLFPQYLCQILSLELIWRPRDPKCCVSVYIPQSYLLSDVCTGQTKLSRPLLVVKPYRTWDNTSSTLLDISSSLAKCQCYRTLPYSSCALTKAFNNSVSIPQSMQVKVCYVIQMLKLGIKLTRQSDIFFLMLQLLIFAAQIMYTFSLCMTIFTVAHSKISFVHNANFEYSTNHTNRQQKHQVLASARSFSASLVQEHI